MSNSLRRTVSHTINFYFVIFSVGNHMKVMKVVVVVFALFTICIHFCYLCRAATYVIILTITMTIYMISDI